jgi:hypothetical protein
LLMIRSEGLIIWNGEKIASGPGNSMHPFSFAASQDRGAKTDTDHSQYTKR